MPLCFLYNPSLKKTEIPPQRMTLVVFHVIHFFIRIEISLLHRPIGHISKNLKQSLSTNQPTNQTHSTVQKPLSRRPTYNFQRNKSPKRSYFQVFLLFLSSYLKKQQADLLNEGYETTWQHLLIHKTVSARVGGSFLTKELLEA